jgi:hypothetical protein
VLRGLRTAGVAHGDGARLAATVSLVLAAAKIREHAVIPERIAPARAAECPKTPPGRFEHSAQVLTAGWNPAH